MLVCIHWLHCLVPVGCCQFLWFKSLWAAAGLLHCWCTVGCCSCSSSWYSQGGNIWCEAAATVRLTYVLLGGGYNVWLLSNPPSGRMHNRCV